MSRWRIWLPLFAFALLALLLARGLQLNPHELPSPLVGKPVPALTLTALHEGGAGLRTDGWRGRVTLLNVWASWCGPCREEHPQLLALARRHPGVRVAGLNYKDEPQAARRWLAQLGDPFAEIGADLDGRAGIELGVYGVPETFVVDAQGRILFKHVGPLTDEVIARRIEPLLKEGA